MRYLNEIEDPLLIRRVGCRQGYTEITKGKRPVDRPINYSTSISLLLEVWKFNRV